MLYVGLILEMTFNIFYLIVTISVIYLILQDMFSNRSFQDVVLAAMQEELDSLCEQVNNFKDQPDTMYNTSSTKNMEFSAVESFTEDVNHVGCGCQTCDYHQYSLNDPVVRNCLIRVSNFSLRLSVVQVVAAVIFFFFLLTSQDAFLEASDGDKFNYQLPLMNVAEPEERRMSNLSDWAPSIISSLDIQVEYLRAQK